jgi:hypothetical protein
VGFGFGLWIRQARSLREGYDGGIAGVVKNLRNLSCVWVSCGGAVTVSPVSRWRWCVMVGL